MIYAACYHENFVRQFLVPPGKTTEFEHGYAKPEISKAQAMLKKSRAIVLHSLKYGESSLIVHCYTEQWGRQSFLVKGVRKSRRQQRVNYFQPLFVLDMEVYFRDNRDLQWIKEVGFHGSVPDFQGNLTKSTQAIFLSEVMMKVLREEEKNEALFEFIYRSLAYFESLENASSSFHILFLFQLTRFLGFYPRNNYSEREEFFDVVSGAFREIPSSASIDTEKMLGTYWRSCFGLSYIQADQEFTNKKERNIFLDSLVSFYRHHIDSLGEFKSLDILRTVFS